MNLLTTLLEIFIDVVFVCAIAFGLFWWFALYRLKQIKQQLEPKSLASKKKCSHSGFAEFLFFSVH